MHWNSPGKALLKAMPKHKITAMADFIFHSPWDVQTQRNSVSNEWKKTPLLTRIRMKRMRMSAKSD